MSGAGSSQTTSSDFSPLQRGPEDFFISMFAESDTPSSWLLYPGKGDCSMAVMRKDTHMISVLSPHFQPTLCSALNSTQRWAKAFNLPLPPSQHGIHPWSHWEIISELLPRRASCCLQISPKQQPPLSNFNLQAREEINRPHTSLCHSEPQVWQIYSHARS